jgi:translation initiation factor 1
VRDERVLVYSTDGSLPLPVVQRQRASKPAARELPDDGVVRIAREHRRASAITVVHGLAAAELAAAGKELKRLCGTGGTVKNGVVELQGDHRDKLIAYFTGRGRRVKKAGG